MLLSSHVVTLQMSQERRFSNMSMFEATVVGLQPVHISSLTTLTKLILSYSPNKPQWQISEYYILFCLTVYFLMYLAQTMVPNTTLPFLWHVMDLPPSFDNFNQIKTSKATYTPSNLCFLQLRSLCKPSNSDVEHKSNGVSSIFKVLQHTFSS